MLTPSGSHTPAAAAETELIRRRYDRVAPVYDLLELAMEIPFRRWKRDLWSRVPPGRVLEVGVGTGKSFPYYPAGRDVTAIDLSPRMLARAERRAVQLGTPVRLELVDIQATPYSDHSFDAVVASCVFCSVPDPVRGLREISRVLKPGGRLLLLEHVRSHHAVLGTLMDWLDPIPAHLWGAHIARDTVANVERAGFAGIDATPLALDVVYRIQATRAPDHDVA